MLQPEVSLDAAIHEHVLKRRPEEQSSQVHSRQNTSYKLT
jgi:hypothetical protein